MKWFDIKESPMRANIVFSAVSLRRNLSNYQFMSRLSSGTASSISRSHELIEKVSAALAPHSFDRINTEGVKCSREINFSLESVSNLSVCEYINNIYKSDERFPSALLVSCESEEKECVFVALCGGEHIEITAMRSGNAVVSALGEVYSCEDKIEEEHDFAFDKKLGYLMNSPRECGTGASISVLLFLPMCQMYGKLGEFCNIASLSLDELVPFHQKSGLYILRRGIPPHRNERDYASSFESALSRAVEYERELERFYYSDEDSRERFTERFRRALYMATESKLISADELYTLWQDLRLGKILGLPDTEDFSFSALDRLSYLFSYDVEARDELSFCRASAKRVHEALSLNTKSEAIALQNGEVYAQ